MPSITSYIIPGFVAFILIFGMVKKVDCFGSFIEGANEGISTVIKILPSLVGLIVAVGVFRASGAIDILVDFLSPLLVPLGIDPNIMPLAMMRPISGSASLAVLSDIFKSLGPDSFAGRAASIMVGSSETIFYTIAIYLGGSGIKKAPRVLSSAILSHIISVILTCWLCSIWFR